MTRRLLPRAAVALLVASALAGIPASSTAKSIALGYYCSANGFPDATFVVVLDTDAPASLAAGRLAQVTLSARVTVPAVVADQMRSFDITAVDGTAVFGHTVNGSSLQTTTAVPRTSVPSTPGSTFSFEAAGSAGVLGPASQGTVLEIGAGAGATLELDTHLAGGGSGHASFGCLRVGGQDPHVDTVTVKGSTVTKTTAAYHAATHRLVARAKVTAAEGNDPAGEVRFVLKRNGVKIKTATVALNSRDVAKKVFKNIAKPGRYAVGATYLGSPTLMRSTGSDRLSVVR